MRQGGCTLVDSHGKIVSDEGGSFLQLFSGDSGKLLYFLGGEVLYIGGVLVISVDIFIDVTAVSLAIPDQDMGQAQGYGPVGTGARPEMDVRQTKGCRRDTGIHDDHLHPFGFPLFYVKGGQMAGVVWIKGPSQKNACIGHIG